LTSIWTVTLTGWTGWTTWNAGATIQIAV
jgi:hypothetical protein